MKGVCCGCQCVVEVQISPRPIQEELDQGHDDWIIRHLYGDEIHYVVLPHDAWGVPCEGSLQVPQCLVK